ncbi:uncharacterized protein RAG0_07787 [Rhynchosporium agropyri]|uniref:Uncharacterized protein n=1 Tax=Rhynchosporium agropyri TaxID=914238 RepID=A0A1E1KN75_9HELO|nr:uncharacterized protein RAG0_07787 [Rhynchosporium agropyri]
MLGVSLSLPSPSGIDEYSIIGSATHFRLLVFFSESLCLFFNADIIPSPAYQGMIHRARLSYDTSISHNGSVPASESTSRNSRPIMLWDDLLPTCRSWTVIGCTIQQIQKADRIKPRYIVRAPGSTKEIGLVLCPNIVIQLALLPVVIYCISK